MQEIKCPNCGKTFLVDESGYAQIVQQVRDKEFDRELQQREKALEDMKAKDLEIVQMKQKEEFEQRLSAQEAQLAEKERLIEQLKARLSGTETEKQLAVTQAVSQKEQEREAALSQKNNELAEKTRAIEALKARLNNSETEKQLAVSEAVREKEKAVSEKETEIASLKNRLSSQETESALKQQSLHREYESKLKQKDELIEYYKDFKARQSTKMIGESLEQHCLNQFNALRMTAFPQAYFEKDNDARSGSKGDFIFREARDGVEFISIMFEMKNEMDETATKHKNEDFFKELDKDRREKKCEYAVLVSLLEIDNELYNNGIVDVSYKYEKMYVIRPQFFIPIITLLRNAALNSLKYRQELEVARNQQIDVRNFEENISAFKEGFARNYRLASERFKTAIDEIDKTILHLQKTKDALLSSENNLRLANNKAEDLSIKKLTKNAPAVKAMFDDLRRENLQG
ncbi:MAG TPA: DUF2130 domain-containing protein [Candidatus Pullichristensenella stercorigallinarum]|uniref:DUF2130 domain-containing protein n=1 Tax=Candidatus Pullichristensenella stercorigallinarum TaxID=2840909 RepID=A0A9D0ZJC5_9FIRM|nr:DUF2130 domain-containing protein [Candidatus Pullichristensenella stercorigallinarum]